MAFGIHFRLKTELFKQISMLPSSSNDYFIYVELLDLYKNIPLEWLLHP